MNVIQVKSTQELNRRGADLIAAQILIKPNCVLGLATGASPVGVYQELIQKHREGWLDCSSVRTVNLDEYKGLDRKHEQSYFYFMQNNLFSHLNIPAENIHLPNGMAENDLVECRRYDRLIDELGGADLQLLGIGQNGHIGFNEPDDVFTADTHCVALTPSTLQANAIYFDSIEQMPRYAYTMGMRAILQAKKILLLATGPKKAAALAATLTGPLTPQLPASILQLHPDVTILADEAALSLIDSSQRRTL